MRKCHRLEETNETMTKSNILLMLLLDPETIGKKYLGVKSNNFFNLVASCANLSFLDLTKYYGHILVEGEAR